MLLFSDFVTDRRAVDPFVKNRKEMHPFRTLPPAGWLRCVPILGALLLSVVLSAQCPLVCTGDLSLPLGADGTASVTVGNFLQSNPDACSGALVLTMTDATGTDVGTTLTAAQLDQTLTATVAHPTTGNHCTSTLTVVDETAPLIDCTDVLLDCTHPTHPDQLGYPTATDNATPTSDLTYQYTDQTTELDCNATHNGTAVVARIDRTWTVTDASGNSATCVQTLYLKRNSLTEIVFPPHHDGAQHAVLDCGTDDPNDLTITGAPTIGDHPVAVGGACGFNVSYFDQTTSDCAGEQQINRTWIVQDYCSDQVAAHIQKIFVEDQTPPALTCPAPAFFNTYPNACGAAVTLPGATATDACSDVTLGVSWQFGSGYGPFPGVPAGTYDVTYTATDACGNIAVCTAQLTVADDDAPLPYCEQSVTVQLQDDGTALVFAQTFDNGSYDNCGIDRYEVSRDGTHFDDFVDFTCADLGQTIPVTLRVFDAAGQSANCITQAVVLDQLPPVISCPAPANVACGADLNNLAALGQPFATDNCGTTTATYVDQENLNLCGTGSIQRVWTVTDAASCTQLLYVSDQTPMTATFPGDTLLTVCGPDLSVDALGAPTVSGVDCEQWEVTHTDYFFYDAEPACFKVIRNWAVIDWCTYQPNDPSNAGILEHTQVILVEDHDAPDLDGATTQTATITTFSCETYVHIPVPTVDDCSQQLERTHNSPYADQPGADASGTYPEGTHTIVWTVTDGCGNAATHSLTLTVTDGNAPSPVCNNGVNVTLGTNGLVVLTPDMIDGGSTDNCTAATDLILQVSPNVFDCATTGQQWVTLSATDDAGNSSFCTTMITVQDNLGVCGNASATLTGKLQTEAGNPVTEKLVGVTGGVNLAGNTNANGVFQFDDLPVDLAYTVRPTHTSGVVNGVSSLDLVHITRHILNIQALDSPYKMIAADANGSGTVTALDQVAIRRVILGLSGEFPNHTPSWRFVPVDYVFSDPSNPFADDFPEEITIDPLTVDLELLDFVGIKIGDVNGSNTGNNLHDDDDGITEERTTTNTVWSLTDRPVRAGERFTVLLRAATASRLGWQAQFDWNAGALTLERTDLDAEHQRLEANSVRISAPATTDAVLTALTFRSHRDGRLSDWLRLNPTFAAEEYRSDTAHNITITRAELRFRSADSPEFSVGTATPNPFRQTITVALTLPEAGDVTHRWTDALGRVLYERTEHRAAGTQRLRCTPEGVTARGLLFLTIDYDGRRRTQRVFRE